MLPDPDAFLIEFDRDALSPHYFGGDSVYDHANCPNCERPLLVYLSLDTSDPVLANKLSFGRSPNRFEVLFCPRCELSWGDFRYRVYVTTRRLEIVDFTPGDDIEDLPLSIQVDRFPKIPIRLRSLPMHVQSLYLARREGRQLSDSEVAEVASITGDFARSELGGYPFLKAQCQLFGMPYMQQNIDPPRSTLGATMDFLASFAWDPKLPFQILPDGVQLFIWYEASTGEIVAETVI